MPCTRAAVWPQLCVITPVPQECFEELLKGHLLDGVDRLVTAPARLQALEDALVQSCWKVSALGPGAVRICSSQAMSPPV